ncbi:MAG TPA: hypothetical protein VFS00_07475, partial [Polyangiaceae bacterium]|nr:hypothetical protein [Polyangiaceae bacterium]
AADHFAAAVRAPDERDGHVRISPARPWSPPPSHEGPKGYKPRGEEAPPAYKDKRPFSRHSAAPRWASPR